MANTPNLKGATFAICTTAQEDMLDEAGFDALTYVTVGKIVEHGNIAVSESDNSISFWGDEWVLHQKGMKDGGETSVQIGFDPDSTGEDALDTASETDLNYAFRIDVGDNDGGSTNTLLYYRGLITLPEFQLGANESFVTKTYTIRLNQGVTQVDPT